MKIQARILSFLLVLLVIIAAIPNICLAENEIPLKEQSAFCSPPTSVNLTVTIGPTDCRSMHDCSIEVVVWDLEDCSIDNQPIAIKPYIYPDDVLFPSLTINGSKIKVCVRIESGTHCYEVFYPHCICVTPYSPMNISFDVCVP